MMKDNNLESTFKKKADKLNAEVRPKLWDKLEKRMDDHYASTSPASPTQIIQMEWMRYAAAFALLIVGGFLLSKIGSTNSPNSFRMANNFVIEEVDQVGEADQIYKEMVDFSHKYYNTLINPGAKRKTPL